MTGPLSASAIFLRRFWGHAFGDPDGPMTWRPFTTLTYWIDWHVGGGRPFVFHLTNLLLFFAVLWMAARFLRAFAGDELGPGARALIVAAFAALAIHADVVPSATGRGELLAALFALVALDATLARRPVVVGIALAAAALSKESALPMTVLAPLLAWMRGPRDRRAMGAILAASALVLLAYASFRVGRIPFGHGEEQHFFDNPLYALPATTRAFAVPQVLGHYVAHAGSGIELCPDYSDASIVPVARPTLPGALGAAVIAACALALAWGMRRRDLLAHAVLGFGASYVVVSHVFFPGIQLVADRLLFLPSFWLIALVAIPLSRALRAPRARDVVAAAVAVFVLAQSALAANAALAWRDDASLFRRGVRACPTNMRLRVERARTAEGGDERAYNLAIAAAVFVTFPAPIPEDRFPAAWEERPVRDRIAALEALHTPSAWYLLKARTAQLALGQEMPDAAAAVRTWP
ncbi:MAG: hypothetical protein HYV09_39830 [Deltaproteobacteria bacterium]|nr:hypothetical protein [Deltaproteobacteria bacterium]